MRSFLILPIVPLIIAIYCFIAWTLTPTFWTSNEQYNVRKGNSMPHVFIQKRRWSTLSGRRQDFFSFTRFPAELNNRSLGTLDAVTQSTRFASRDKYFSCCSLAFHQFKGSRLSSDSGSSASYFLSSLATISWGDISGALSLGKMIMPSKNLVSFLFFTGDSLGSGSVGTCCCWSASTSSMSSNFTFSKTESFRKGTALNQGSKYMAMENFFLTTSSWYREVKSSLMAFLILFVRCLSFSASANVWKSNLWKVAVQSQELGIFPRWLSQLDCGTLRAPLPVPLQLKSHHLKAWTVWHLNSPETLYIWLAAVQ